MGNISQPRTDAVLDGYENDALHPNVIEALKRLDDANDTRARAVKNIDGQYLKSLDALGDDWKAQADAVRAQF